MSEFFLTNPGNQSDEDSKSDRRVPSFDFKELVTEKLMVNWEVPLRVAQVAIIDLKVILYMCYHYKLNPRQTAEMMIARIEQIYKDDNGKWHYT